MKRLSNKQERKKLTSKQKRIIMIVGALLLILTSILLAGSKVVDTWTPIENITSKTIDIQFSTKEIVCDDVKITLETTTEYDIYYYILLKNEETAEEIVFETPIENQVSNNTITSDETNNEVTNTLANTETSNKKISNELYKKYENEIIVENNATIYLKYAKGNRFCNSSYSFEVNNIDKQGPVIGEIETKSTSESITVSVKATDNRTSEFTYYFKLAEDKEFICTDDINEYTFKDLEEEQTYTIYIKVADGFGNMSEAATDCTVSKKVVANKKQTYHIKVNIAANTVTIYSKDDNGEFTKPFKAMICSTGSATPQSGTYEISYKYRWLALFGNVYGQYSTRIVGHILFHSVPYYETEPDTLKYKEYDKLGTKASAGCIRLTVKDAKWIYDNVASGSTVEFYSDAGNPGPLGKPTSQKISDSEYRDWDPTDPDPRNPWLGGDGEIPRDDEEDIDDKPEDDDVDNTVSNEVDNSVDNSIVNNTITDNTVSNDFAANDIPWGTED